MEGFLLHMLISVVTDLSLTALGLEDFLEKLGEDKVGFTGVLAEILGEVDLGGVLGGGGQYPLAWLISGVIRVL